MKPALAVTTPRRQKKCIWLIAICFLIIASAEASEWGNLTGRFVYEGKAPDSHTLAINKNVDFCGEVVDGTLVVDEENGGLANVVIWVRNLDGEGHPDYAKSARDDVFIETKRCRAAHCRLPFRAAVGTAELCWQQRQSRTDKQSTMQLITCSGFDGRGKALEGSGTDSGIFAAYLPLRYIDGMTATIPKYRLFIADNFWSLFGTSYLLLFDVVFSGSFELSIIVCPIWFLVSAIRNDIVRTEWRIALIRMAIPALTLGIVLANTFIQWKIADINGERIVNACESFHSDDGRYPKTLNELVPRYLPSVPRAKYCMDGDFHYFNSEDELPPILWWNKFGFLRRIYSFDSRGWHYLD